MRLLAIVVMARTPLKERLPLTKGLAAATRRADESGLKGTAALGTHLLAILAEETSQYGQAAKATIRSAEFARSMDKAAAAGSIAFAARCLLFLQRDVPRAHLLLAEAQGMGVESTELALGWGYLHAHEGRTEEATPWLERAFALAAREQDHWREFAALFRLTAMALEDGDAARALALCPRLRGVTAKMAGGSEPVRAEMMETLARLAGGEPVEVEPMLANLRDADSQSDLAWALTVLAEMELGRGDRDGARLHAAEALEAADLVGRASEAVIARAILARLSHGGTGAEAARTAPVSADLTARARRYMEENEHGDTRPRADVRAAGHGTGLE
jgi:tetratricopeptide (TPR) repeat protein